MSLFILRFGIPSRTSKCLQFRNCQSFVRWHSMLNSQALVFDEHGEPNKVLKLKELNLNHGATSGQIKIKMKAAPLNPSDTFSIQGTYPLKPSLPGVAGHAGVGEVTEVGENVNSLSVGDWVVPLESALGTYRSQGIFNAEDWHKVPSDIPLECASCLTINPPTALGMLEAFTDLQEGDVVVQNGATGDVGKNVIQLCKAKNVKSVNIIRQSPDFEHKVQLLKGLGADIVSTEDAVRNEHKQAGLPPPKLAINCIGGESATTMAKMLVPGGFHVTYGAMGGGYLSVPPALLIFRDINVRGFWVSGGYARRIGKEGKAALFDRCVEYMKRGLMKPTVKWFELAEFEEAFKSSVQPHKTYTVMFKM
eukprot:TRINITY_DN10045_c0_g1_i6.p2 TRINITY_DN10045_c0_g1~~TRINITY_DN10045_c0_g1_i6.p2  ORF type:complete len:364 (-),score=45.97 TRINITY_DN10045_c0_g1_i6:347-1438(-)